MGSMKERWMQEQEEERDERLARHLGITPGELRETDFHFDEETDNEGNTLNNLIVFTSISDKIKQKIKGLNGNTVIIDISKF